MIRLRTVLATGLLILVAFLVLPPFLMLFVGSIWGAPPGMPGRLSLSAYIDAFSSPYTYKVIANSFFLSFVKTTLATIWGVVLAWLVTRTDVPLRRTMEVLIYRFSSLSRRSSTLWLISCCSIPIAASSMNMFMGAFGLESAPFNLYSYTGMIFVMALGSTAFIFLLTYGAFRALDPSLEESARTCGAGTLETYLRVTLPLVAPAIGGAFILSFIQGIEAFEVPVLIGTPAGIYVFTNEIYRAITFFEPARYGVATALGITIVLLTFAMVYVQWRIQGDRQYFTITGKGYNPRLVRLKHWRWPAFIFGALYIVLAVVLPIGQLLLSSLQSNVGVLTFESFTLKHYYQAFRDDMVLRALYNTLILAVLAAVGGVTLSVLIAYVTTRLNFSGKRWLELLSWLPWTLPGIVLATGMLWAYLTIPGLWIFYGSLWILFIAYIIKGLPLGVRALSGTMVQVHQELEDCARVHGASWLRTLWSVVLRLIRPGMLSGAIFFVFIAIRDLSTPILLYGYGTEVLSIVLLQFWAEKPPQVVSVLAIIMLAVLTGFSAIQRVLLIEKERPEAIEGRVPPEIGRL